MEKNTERLESTEVLRRKENENTGLGERKE